MNRYITPTPIAPKTIYRGKSYLGFHDGLLKARANHGLLARLLVGGPGGGTVGSLHAANTLADLGGLLQSTSWRTEGLSRLGIGSGDIGRGLPRGRVVGWDGVLVQTRDGRGVGADSEARAGGRKGHESATTGHHAGQISTGGGLW
jgi:hypothetical protein